MSRKRPKKNANPLQHGIAEFLSSLQICFESSDIPKRYTRYGSLLLVGPTFLHHSKRWREIFSSLSSEQRDQLFQMVLGRFPDKLVTNIAMNAPVSMTTEMFDGSNNYSQLDNVMRSPHNFQPLHGHFGPEICPREPSVDDFHAAYWADTIQLHDLSQIWAPRWTMFSRGNITEKARILQDGTNTSPFPGLTVHELGEDLSNIDIVDFYVGIGYFTFCYLSRGVKRVWGWDINGWSIEGLRRGCIKNNYGVIVAKVAQDGTTTPTIEDLVCDIERYDQTDTAIRCVAFLGDNSRASQIMDRVSAAMVRRGDTITHNVRHCNLGLLPSSKASWQSAWKMLNPNAAGWLHIHENIDIHRIEEAKAEIVRELGNLSHTTRQVRQDQDIVCEHVEQVKTYAPGVMHCVFDIKISPFVSSSS